MLAQQLSHQSEMAEIDLETLVDNLFGDHPFTSIPANADFQKILANFLAMSQAFPYLQAGSQQALIFHYMNQNADVPVDVELTSVVGNFLCWDETGGFYLTLASGVKGLPRLLETRRFHSNLLKKDLNLIFNQEIKPDYAPVTQAYLTELHRGLSAICPIERVAYMVGFETHANRMISALWDSLALQFPVDKNKLAYFHTHVGGEDPAEAYHVEMTNNLIGKLVPTDKIDLFKEIFTKAYRANHDWCMALTRMQ